ncbi:MAG: ABC transporter ATP-binding protein [Gemmatimonadaceae bacterium]
MTAPCTLSLEGLTRRFGSNASPSVDGVNLRVECGELLALVGPSGSGKTTTLRMIAGFERPDAGRILLEGKDITALPPQRRDFGMVFQHYALFPHMSVGENVAFGLEARGASKAERRARAAEILDSVGLGSAIARPVQSLSGGEQQRVALARALVIEPRVLLLDEPLSNLDPTLRRATREELRSTLHRLGVTAVFVTHDQEDAFAVADRVAILKGGRLLQVGSPEELYDLPVSRDVAEFIGSGTLVPARRDGDYVAIAIGGVTHPARAAGAATGAVLAVLRPDALAFVPPESAGAWTGTVRERRFTGTLVAYGVELAGGVRIEVHAIDRAVCQGDRVAVRIVREPVAVVAP